MSEKKNKIKQANVNIHIKDLFFRWLEITSFLHGLTTQQKRVLSLFLYHHFKLKQEISNNKLLWKLVFDYDIKHQIKEELNIKDSVLQNILTKFRKIGIIKDNVILSLYIPDLEKETTNFKILFNFNIIHD
jgi:D-mannonate dehydratase